MVEVDKITDGDLMGTRLHQGLDYFLWKMSLPNTPSYNINADLKFSVRLWFHNGIGNIFPNPFLVLNENEFGNFTRNYEFEEHSHRGLQMSDQMDGEGIELGKLCFDMTPFVQSITLPNIGTTAETKVDTLLGNMQVGSYSPYSSDGGQEITFTVIDTQYSILDAIFYPWLKMIGSPRWYDPNDAYEGHSTPYPICTIEIATPMRWAPEPGGTQEEKKLTPYVYQYIGARPKSYTIPEINAESRSSITRTLTMVCDLVIVDMNKDSKLKKFRKEDETVSVNNPAYAFMSGEGIPPVQTPDGANDEVPENAPTPSTEDVNAANEDVNQAQNDVNNATKDVTDQERDKEPGMDEETGPEPPDTNPDEDGGDDEQGGDEDQGGGDEDQGGGDGTGPDSGGGEGGGDEGGGGGSDSQPSPFESAAVSSDSIDDSAAIAATASNIQSLLNLNVPAGAPARRSASKRGVDKSLFVCSAIKAANDARRSMLREAIGCIEGSDSDYSKSGVMGTMRDEIPQQFDSLVVGPIIDCVDNPSAMAELGSRIVENMDSCQSSLYNRYDYRLSDAKAIGNVIDEVQPVLRDGEEGYYSRVLTMRESMERIREMLPDFKKNAAESFFAMKSLQAIDRFPNASLSMHSEPDTDMWVVGAYLVPLHNSLISAFGLASDDNPPLPPDSYPFVLRHSWFKSGKFLDRNKEFSGFTKEQEFATLRDALDMCDAERREMNLGVDSNGLSCSLESVSLWEITDKNLNHTGVYWCKSWLVRRNQSGEIVSGKLVICKLNYLGTVLTDDFAFDEDTMERIADGIVESRASFTKATAASVYSQDDSLEAKKGGQAESHFNPLTAIVESKRYSLTREYAKVSGRDGSEHSDLVPTEYVHIEEWPEEGDVEAEIDEQGFYTMSSMDESGVLTQYHYKLEAKSAYEAQTMLENEPQAIVPLMFGALLGKFHTESGKYGWLAVKRHDCWDGMDSAGEPYPTVHTTNSEEDMFNQYIPGEVEYVAQYRHHKTRWRTAKSEQAKLKQLIARVAAKALEFTRRMKDGKDFISEKVTEEKVNRLLETISKMEEISKAYNVLIELEVKQEKNLKELKDALASVTSKHASVPYSNLQEKLSIVDSVHLHTLSVSRVEEELGSIRDKQKELEEKYAAAKAERDEAIGEISDDIDKVYDTISSCMCDSWMVPLLTKGYNDALEYFRGKEDRRILMERLVVFFDRRIAEIEDALVDDPGNVSLADVILSCDWKAFGDWTTEDTEEIRRIREEANRLGYRLRVKRLLPSLKKNLEKAIKKRDKLVDESMDATRLVYEPDYAYPGYVPKDDSDDNEQEPVMSPRSSVQAAALEKIIKEYDSMFPAKPVNAVKRKNKESKDIGEKKVKLLKVYRELGADFANYSESELENSLLLVLSSEYLNSDEGSRFRTKIVESRSMIERTKKAVEAYKKESDKEVQLITAAKKKTSAIKDSVDRIDNENLSMLRKFGSDNLPRDEMSQFRLNALKKADLMKSLDASESVLNELVQHYEQKTMPALSSYADGLETARESYDMLMEKLGKMIDFDDKVEQLYDAIFG